MALIDPESDLCDADASTLAYLLVIPSTEGDSVSWEEEAAALGDGSAWSPAPRFTPGSTGPTSRRTASSSSLASLPSSSGSSPWSKR